MDGCQADPMNTPALSNELAGRVIAVTGVTGGIGREVALAALHAGADLILLSRNKRKLQALYTQMQDIAPGKSFMVELDLEKALASDYDRIAAAIVDRFGRLDGLVHCAGQLGTLTPIEQYDVPTWCKVLHVNLTAAFALTQVLLPALRNSADASVIFTSSAVGRKGRAYWGAYAVSKFAVEGLVQVLAQELLATSNVRVNALNPGPTRTAMRRQAFPSEDIETLPLPQTIADAYLRLLGPRGVGLTGQSVEAQPPRSR
jgi:NAD(P)-dependent dehydrogenase (short-subunit alcohol dehydrogenase family)